MTIINTTYQNIVLESLIILRLAMVENANYNVQFNLVGINGLHGFGNWTSTFKGILNESGCPMDVAFPLTGNGVYNASGCPSISSFVGDLQINIIYPPATPLPTKPPVETKWKGNITLTGGSVMGALSSIKGEISPSIYNVKATYDMKFINGVSNLFIKNMTIISNN